MKAFTPHEARAGRATDEPSDELRIAVTFPRPGGNPGPTKFGARISSSAAPAFTPEPLQVDMALAELARRGFEVTARGKLTASIRGSRQVFEKVFGTHLSQFRLSREAPAQFRSFYYPANDAPWNPEPAIQSMIDDAYIQWPHLYMQMQMQMRGPAQPGGGVGGPDMARVSAVPPRVNYPHLHVPTDVARLLNATAVHREGITGRGVRVVMIDSGFTHAHPFFRAQGYRSSVVLAPKAINRRTDPNGHGTGESANVFAVAPGATFIGVKLDNDRNPAMGASILEGFQEALKHKPHVISVSLGYDLRDEYTGGPLSQLPNSLVALEAEIQAAVAAGIIVVFAAGNGHYAFPGQMPEVISAGGVYIDPSGQMMASDYASAFPSSIYSGRSVPDCCGLVGMQPNANYIMLPVPPKCEIDINGAEYDETAPSDGWGVFSGTSAAAPQLAGLCALLLEADRRLTPGDVKAILRRTSRDVAFGNANAASDPFGGNGLEASLGEDGATGAGLVDAYAAFRQVVS